MPTTIRHNTLWLLTGRVLGQLLLFLFTLIVARALGDVGLGQFAFISAIVFIGNVLSTFGVDTLLLRDTARYAKTATERGFSATLTAALLIQLAIALLFVLGLLLLLPLFANHTAATRQALLILSLSLFPLAAVTLAGAVLRGRERMDLLLLVTLTTAVAQTGGAFLLLRSGGTLVELAAWLVIVQLLTAVVAHWLARRALPDLHFGPPDTATLRRTLLAGAPLAALMVLAVTYQRLGVLALGRFADDATTGWFSAAARLVEAAKLLPYALYGALFPAMARAAFAPSPRYRQAFAALLLYACATAVGLTLLATPLTALLFGTDFLPAAPALRVLAWSLPPFAVSLRLSFELVARGRERAALAATAVTFVITALLVTTLTSAYGLTGACTAVVLGECAHALAMFAAARRTGARRHWTS